MSAATNTLTRLRERSLARLREGEAEWISGIRDEAFASFVAQGFPTRRLEAWKGTSLARLEKIAFDRVGSAEPSPIVVTGTGVPTLRFLDGRLDTANSEASNLPEGVRLLSFAEARRQAPELLEGRLGLLADPKRHALVALQTGFLDDGAVLAIDPDVELASPIRLLLAVTADASTTPTAAFPRLLVIAGERSRGSIYLEHETVSLESRAGTPSASSTPQTLTATAPGLTAFVAELHVGAGARFESVQIQNEGADRIHFTSMHARLGRDARYESHVFSLSPGLVRSELEVMLAEPGAEARLCGFFLGRGQGHVDHFTTVDHAAPHCTSDEEYRGVLDDHSAGVFRGRVIVRPGAQKTDARQSNPNLLISDHARIDSKPQLEIYADDIKASHGSTIGQLDQDALFFLRARGIDAAEARGMLTRAFARAIVDRIETDSLRDAVSVRLEAALDTPALTGVASTPVAPGRPGGEVR